ncbi:MAG: hypothetical protein EBS23_04135 [Betaproteobacteria bacterium]|nr:hypothetical protein [Betaproteobacteria bacterium]
MVRLISRQLEELGRQLLAEIGLDRPHIIADGPYGSVRIPYRSREIEAPWPTSTIEELHVLAHELGHWQLHTEELPRGRWAWRDGLQPYVMEYESEQYAHRRLEALGVPVPETMLAEGKDYVGSWVRRYLRDTADLPDAKITAWAGIDIDRERKAEWGITAHRMLGRYRRDRYVPVDVLVGFIERYAKPGTEVDLIATSTRGKNWLEQTACARPLKRHAEDQSYRVQIEDMLTVARAVPQAVFAQRC